MSPTFAMDRGFGLPVVVRLLLLDPLVERIAGARIGQEVDDLHDLLGLEPLLLFVGVVHALESEHQTLGADAIAQREQVLLAALPSNLAQRQERLRARADLACRALPGALPRRLVLNQGDQLLGVLARVARGTVA
jgi:hypothetical protein